MTIVERPTADDLAEWMKAPAATPDMELALAAALEAQAAACWTAPYTAARRGPRRPRSPPPRHRSRTSPPAS